MKKILAVLLMVAAFGISTNTAVMAAPPSGTVVTQGCTMWVYAGPEYGWVLIKC